MSSFTDTLQTDQISIKPRRWKLKKSFRYYVGKENSDKWIDVLEGFVFDGGSIPRCVWWVDAPMGDGAQAYCLHDVLYAAEAMPRGDGDKIMLEGLQVLGMGWARRRIIYNQVWMWGWCAWKDHTYGSIYQARQFIETSWELPPIRNFPPEILRPI